MLLEHFKRQGKQDLVDGFKLSPKAPHYLSEFLKLVLVEKLKMDEESSARWVAQLANLLKPFEGDKYAKLAYFDIEERKFKWG